MENPIDAEKIEAFRNEKQLSKTRFCKACNICLSTYGKILTGQNFQLSALLKIARFMGLEFYQLFR